MKKVFAIAAAALTLMCVAVGCKAIDDVESKAESMVSEAKDMVSGMVSDGKDTGSVIESHAESMVSDVTSNMK